VDNDTGCSVVLSDYAGSIYTADKTAGTMALLSLASVIDSPGNTLAAGEQN
jgi:hypothetical protein